jgi:DNA-binding YbaB/EbfC family protein
MFSKLKQFRDLRNQAKTIQNALKDRGAEGSADWGKVRVAMDGNMTVTSVIIAPELLKTESKSKLESAVKEAVNEAVKKTQRLMAETVQKMGGLNLPGAK